MKNLIALIICLLFFAPCKSQTSLNKRAKILYIINTDSAEVSTNNLLILPNDVADLNVLNKFDDVKKIGDGSNDVVITITPKSYVKLLNLKMLLESFNLNQEWVNFNVKIDGIDAVQPYNIYAANNSVVKIDYNISSRSLNIITKIEVNKSIRSEKMIN